jgi:predicted dehydrogenase
MGAQHAAAWADVPEVQIAGIAGRGPRRAAALAERYGSRGVGDMRALFDDPSVDAIDVTVPTALHAEVCGAALAAGKHVLCETPLARDATEGAAMMAQARSAARHLQVALLNRFVRPTTDLHAVLSRGTQPLAMHMERFAPGTAGTHHGDVLEEILLFDLDTAVHAFGRPARVLCAAVRGPGGRLDHATALLDYRTCVVTCEASYLHPRSAPFTAAARIWYERLYVEGHLEMPRDGAQRVRVLRRAYGQPPEEETGAGPDPVVEECRHFAGVVEGRGDAVLMDVSQAVAGLRVLDALRASVLQGTWIDMLPR